MKCAWQIVLIFYCLLSSAVKADPASLEIQAKATVLQDLCVQFKTHGSAIGVVLPSGEIKNINAYLDLKNTEIISKEALLARFPNCKDLSNRCFGVKLQNINSSQATLVGGNTPFNGWFQSYLYHLKRKGGRWVIESRELYFES
jgi:hypothetical protein